MSASWLQLEQAALGEAAVPDAVRTDAATQQVWTAIGQPAPLLPLRLPSAPRVKRATAWWPRVAWTLAASMAISLVVWWWPAPRHALPSARVALKGGDLSLRLVREREGVTSSDVAEYRTTDRWQALVTCPYAEPTPVRVWIHEPHGFVPFSEPVLLRCGNGVVFPQAFSLSAPADAVCVGLGAEPAACVPVVPVARD